MIYLAHSARDDIPAQKYAEHVSNVYDSSYRYAQECSTYAYDSELLMDIVRQSATVHDMGKLEQANQIELHGNHGHALSLNHVDAGTAWLLNNDNIYSPTAAVTVYSHHIGLPSFPKEEAQKGNDMFRDVKLQKHTDEVMLELESIQNKEVKKHIPDNDGIPESDLPVFLRMSLSCLVDADHTDTAINYKNWPKNEIAISLRPSERLQMLEKYVDNLAASKNKDSERVKLRRDMFAACRDAKIDSSFCACDSPVGSGKTTAVMAHLLKQAEVRNLRRIFVVLPFTNIIQQSVEIYREALTLPGENPQEVVAELHHRADFENDDLRHLSTQWQAPIVVTTAVSFFETLASRTPSTLRKLHQLPGSAIFLDEAHAALPPKLLPISWRWMNILAESWGCYWLLASGSLSEFWKLEDIRREFVQEVLYLVLPQVHERLHSYEKQRVNYCYRNDDLDLESLVSWTEKLPGPRLLILNTVQNAAVVAKAIETRFGRKKVEHISTSLTAEDREKTLKEIKRRLKNKENDTDWTLVATSCVEAGVDLSFRTGMREAASLTSLLQTAGRIDREGVWQDSEIWTFFLKDGHPFNRNKGLETSARILKLFFEKRKDITPQLCTVAITLELNENDTTKEMQRILDAEDACDFPEVEERFQIIDNSNIIALPDTIADEGEFGFLDWKILQRKSLQIPKWREKDWNLKLIQDGLYRWTLPYDSFLGYMGGVLNLQSAKDDFLCY